MNFSSVACESIHCLVDVLGIWCLHFYLRCISGPLILLLVGDGLAYVRNKWKLKNERVCCVIEWPH